MSQTLVHNIAGDSAVKIARAIEAEVRENRWQSGDVIPSVRSLAEHCGVSPATVASAIRKLRDRGVLVTDGRRGTRISPRQVARPSRPLHIPAGVRDLCTGNPDPRLLPDLKPILRRIDARQRLYGEPPNDPELVRLVQADFQQLGITRGDVVLVNGALDGMERVLSETTRVGDRIGVEDPSFANVLDLLGSRGLQIVPVAVDAEGMRADELARACATGISAVVITPRAQNPTGVALTLDRSDSLSKVLRRFPEVLVIEDDHGALTSDVDFYPVHTDLRRWVHIRSFSKGLGPDLRLAAMTGDAITVRRIQDRMVVGERWVSHLLQRTACELLADSKTRRQFGQAAMSYAKRREGLVRELGRRGLHSDSISGYNVWVPVLEETPVVRGLMDRGWAVAPGERFRIRSSPAIRITTATLLDSEIRKLAADIHTVVTDSCQFAAVI